MREMRTIEIDFDIHKLIEAERQSFSEVPNTVLRRLLKLENADVPESQPSLSPDPDRGAWIWKGVKLPAGTELRMEYRGKEHRGVIQNSAWVVEGETFKSPSAAAGGVTVTRNGARPSLDGWKYWFVKLPGNPEWTALGNLRHSVGRG